MSRTEFVFGAIALLGAALCICMIFLLSGSKGTPEGDCKAAGGQFVYNACIDRDSIIKDY